MIRSFLNRRPGLSGLLIAGFLFLLPAAFMLLDDFVLGGALHAAAVFFYFSLAVQTVLMVTAERPILAAEPFLIGLVGLCAGEILYAVSESAANPGAGPGLLAYFTSSYLIAICGANAAAAVGALILYFLFLAGRKIWEAIKYR